MSRQVAFGAVLLAVVVAACGGSSSSTAASSTAAQTTTTARPIVNVDQMHGCLRRTGFRLIDEDKGLSSPRYEAMAEFDLDLGDQKDTSGLQVGSAIGVYVYADPDQAQNAAHAVGGAAPQDDEVVGNVVLSGARRTVDRNEKFPADIARVESCAQGRG